MSDLGNVLLVHDLVKSVPGETIRWALLSAHYRAPLDWDDTVIERAGKALNTLQIARRRPAKAPRKPNRLARGARRSGRRRGV